MSKKMNTGATDWSNLAVAVKGLRLGGTKLIPAVHTPGWFYSVGKQYEITAPMADITRITRVY